LESRLDALRKSAELHSPKNQLDEKSARLLRMRERLDSLVKSAYDASDAGFRTLCARLEGVNPLSVLSHGYAMVQSEDGAIVSSVDDVSVGSKISVSLADGRISAQITDKNKDRGV